MLGRGRKIPFPVSLLAPPGSGPRPAPFCSRRVLGGCGAARTWGWPGGRTGCYPQTPAVLRVPGPLPWLERSDADRCMVQGDGIEIQKRWLEGRRQRLQREEGMEKEQELKTCCEGHAATAKMQQMTWRRRSPGVQGLLDPGRDEAGGMKPLRPTRVGIEAHQGTLALCQVGKGRAGGCFQLRATPVAKPPSHKPWARRCWMQLLAIPITLMQPGKMKNQRARLLPSPALHELATSRKVSSASG